MLTYVNIPDFQVKHTTTKDIIDLDEYILIVFTDRVSGSKIIPDRGLHLFNTTTFWFNHFPQIPNHLAVNHSISKIIDKFSTQLHGRTLICHKADVIPIKFRISGYLVNIADNKYQYFEDPICELLDENNNKIDYKSALQINAAVPFLIERSVSLYKAASSYTVSKGIIIVKTQFEFGYIDSYNNKTIVLIDEILTDNHSEFLDLRWCQSVEV